MDYARQIYTVLVYSSYGLLTLTLVGVSSFAPKYLQLVRNVFHIFVALFLIWQFNPLRAKRTLSSIDKDIVFASGLLLAASSTVGLVVSEYASSTVSSMSTHWLSSSGAS